MRHGTWGWWTISRAPRIAAWLATVGIGAMVLFVGLWMVPADDGSSVRITEALRLNIASQGFSPPEPQVHAGKMLGNWQSVALPHASAVQWQAQQEQDAQPGALQSIPTELTWYRLQVPALKQPTAALYLFIPRWKFNGTLAIYADGVLVHQTHANLEWNGSNQPRWIDLPHTTASVAPHELLFRVQHVAATGEGLSSVWIGSHEALFPRYARLNLAQVQLGAVSSAAFLATGLFALMVWLQRRAEPIYVLFFLMSAFNFVCSLHSYVGENRLLLSDAWFGWVTFVAMLWMVFTFYLFLGQLHGRRHPWVTRAFFLSCTGLSLATLPGLTAPAQAPLFLLAGYLFIVAAGASVSVLGLCDSLRAASRDGLLLSGWVGVIALSGMADWLMQSNLIGIESVFLTKHASVGIVFVFWYIMFHRYVSALGHAQKAKDDLAARLQARETELAVSYSKLRQVEQREAIAQERQRMMQDMHDGLGSSLRTALLHVEKGRPTDSTVAEVLQGCIDDLKLAIDSMEPVQADLLLLLATWRFRLEPRLEETGITMLWEVSDVPALDWLDPKSALHILRILQEALTNIIKHANATEIRVATVAAGDHVRVTITDNGQGFAVEPALHGVGKGLSNQMRRAEAIDATLKWRSSSIGTTVTLQLPIEKFARTQTN